MPLSNSANSDQAGASPELTGGAGYTYEDSVVAYYLTALLREEGAAGQAGVVTRVAVQQAAQGEPLDDVIVDTLVQGASRRLSLQVKRSLTISAAESNSDFRWIVQRARESRKKPNFSIGSDRYGFAVEFVTESTLRSLKRIIQWASDSPTGADFEARFNLEGPTSNADKSLRQELKELIAPTTSEEEADFYRHFVALRLEGFDKDQPRYADVVNQLSDLLVPGSQTGATFFSALCHQARLGAGSAKIWTRPSLLKDLKDRFRLKAAPSYAHDLTVIDELATRALREISNEIDGVHIERRALIIKVYDRLATNRFVNISGLPGTGKSAVLRTVVDQMMKSGPVLNLPKSEHRATLSSVWTASIGSNLLSARSSSTSSMNWTPTRRLLIGRC
jgi:hypothetical protein